jgi:hypothetical protein
MEINDMNPIKKLMAERDKTTAPGKLTIHCVSVSLVFKIEFMSYR